MGEVREKTGLEFRVIAVDPNASRREKLQAVLATISTNIQANSVVVADIPEAKDVASKWTEGLGCNAVLEVSTPMTV